MLAAIIFTFCGFADSKVSEDNRWNCSDYILNCSVTKAGIEEKTVNECKNDYARKNKKNN
jgi:hypothetical protein